MQYDPLDTDTPVDRPAAPEVILAAHHNLHAHNKPIQLKGVRHDGSSRRFYNRVGVLPRIDASGAIIGYAPTLNGRTIETAMQREVLVPTSALAHALSLEWDAQLRRIVPSTMPLMTIAVTAIDLAAVDPDAFHRHFNGAMRCDLLCVRVDSPASLAKLQEKHWTPLLRWLKDTYGVALNTTTALAAPQQSEHAMSTLHYLLQQQDAWTLAALDCITTATKSLVIALATLGGRLTMEQAWDAARVEESYQIRQSGRVDGIYGHGIDEEFVRMEIAAAKTFVNLLGSTEQAADTSFTQRKAAAEMRSTADSENK